MKLKDRSSLRYWEQFRKNILASTPVDINETHIDKQERIKGLEANDEAWFKYYFPKYAYAEPIGSIIYRFSPCFIDCV